MDATRPLLPSETPRGPSSPPCHQTVVPELCCCWQPLPSISAGREQAPHPDSRLQTPAPTQPHLTEARGATTRQKATFPVQHRPSPSPASPAAHCLQAPKAADSPLAPGQIRGPPPAEPTESLPAQPHPPFPRVNLPPFHLLIPFSDPYTSLCLFCRHPGLNHPHFSLGPVF